MQVTEQRGLTVGSFLPQVELPSQAAGVSVPLFRRGREATVLMRMHSASCGQCRTYLTRLAQASEDLVSWGARVVVVVPGSHTDASVVAEALNPPFVILSDTDGRVPLENGGVAVADRYGHVYYVCDAAKGHALPAPSELAEWLTFLATQCPECGVPDEPGLGEWGD